VIEADDDNAQLCSMPANPISPGGPPTDEIPRSEHPPRGPEGQEFDEQKLPTTGVSQSCACAPTISGPLRRRIRRRLKPKP
jgi:hypothetical protein